MKTHFSGLSVAIATPFDNNYEIDKEAYRSHVKRMINGGVDHIVVSGTTGESPTFSDDEYEYLISETVALADGNVGVIAGSGSNDTEKTIRRSIMAREAGCTGLLVVSPYYNKPGQEALKRHFTMVADEGRLPVMLYNVPGRTGVNILPQTTAELSQHPYIVAIKEASNDMEQILTVMELVPDDFEIYSGDDAMTMPVMLCGGHGVVSVSANEIPALMKSYVRACAQQNLSKARELHFKLQPLFRANFMESNPTPVKAALNMLGFMDNRVRPPLLEVTEETEKVLKQALTDLNLL
jgi:4-hydroxy-tetrahydrodipicolinate synthase